MRRFGGWRRPAIVLVPVGLWVPSVLLGDRAAGSLGQVRLLGVGSWLLLAALLWQEDVQTRLQVGVVVAYATLVEYTFAGVFGVYVYHQPVLAAVDWFDRVPAFVPPGHGLIYLAAVVAGRRLPRWSVPVAAVAVAGYALWGLVWSPRLDVLGALWAGCLVWFLVRGRAPRVYAAALVVVTYLELMGTGLAVWTWQAHDPITGLIPVGNPPSGAAGGYCFFDAAALALAPWLLRAWRGRPGGGPTEVPAAPAAGP